MTETVLFGVGRMGRALAKGWLQADICKPLLLIEPHPDKEVLELACSDGVELNPVSRPVARVVLAIKPQIFSSVRDQVRVWLHPDTHLISIMAGIGMKRLGEELCISRIIRIMPNLPSILGRGISAWCHSAAIEDYCFIRELLLPLGAESGPVREQDMDSITSLSGCGPAYLFLLASAMNKAACSLGLEKQEASRLTAHTLYGAASMLLEQGADPEALMCQVASAGGATEAALDILTVMEGLIEQAMIAARQRSAELSAD